MGIVLCGGSTFLFVGLTENTEMFTALGVVETAHGQR